MSGRNICDSYSTRTVLYMYSTVLLVSNQRTHMTHGIVEVRHEARAGFHGGGAHFDAGFRVPYQTVNDKDIESKLRRSDNESLGERRD